MKYWGLIADPNFTNESQTLINSNEEIGNAFCGNITKLNLKDNCNDHVN